jgi:hypothetical protein
MSRQVFASRAQLTTAMVGVSQTVSRIAMIGTVHTLHAMARDIQTVVGVAEAVVAVVAVMAVVAGKSQAATRMIRVPQLCSVVGVA